MEELDEKNRLKPRGRRDREGRVSEIRETETFVSTKSNKTGVGRFGPNSLEKNVFKFPFLYIILFEIL